ncbi:hypothetical protein EII34_13730 [Arachnia propionica]|uniref:DDE Tnp4 domain-containing protein n=1 Tax=Arachnia propionica TaxID=1750 RepID=A0A3P1T2Q6_9ACTN|nr:hypothetical protein EII34_13730 [Arachnia propionica]
MTEVLETVLVLTSGGLSEAIQQGHLLLVDGTYIPTGNRPASGQGAANHSGKRKLQCLSIQVAATDRGCLVAVSDPFPGARHDARVIQECGWSDLLAETAATWVADGAYAATTAMTPVKKKPNQPRVDWKEIQQNHRWSPRWNRALHRPPEELEDPQQRLPWTPH